MRGRFGAVVVLLSALPVAAADVNVRVVEGQVEMTASAAPVAEVLDRLAKQTGMKVVYEGPAPRQLVSVSLRGRTPAEAVVDLLEGLGLNYMLIVDDTGARVRTLMMAGTASSAVSASSRSGPPSRAAAFSRRPAPDEEEFFEEPFEEEEPLEAPEEQPQIPGLPPGFPQGFPQGLPQGFPQGFPQGLPGAVPGTVVPGAGGPTVFPANVTGQPQDPAAQPVAPVPAYPTSTAMPFTTSPFTPTPFGPQPTKPGVPGLPPPGVPPLSSPEADVDPPQ